MGWRDGAEGWGGGMGELSLYQGKQTAGGGLSRPQDSFLED